MVDLNPYDSEYKLYSLSYGFRSTIPKTAVAAVMSLDRRRHMLASSAAVDCRYQMSINIVMSLPCGGFVWNWLIGLLGMSDTAGEQGRMDRTSRAQIVSCAAPPVSQSRWICI